MKRLGYFLAVVLLFAAGVWTYQQFFAGSDEPAADGQQIEPVSLGGEEPAVSGAVVSLDPPPAFDPKTQPPPETAPAPRAEPPADTLPGEIPPGKTPPGESTALPADPGAVLVLGGALDSAPGAAGDERKEAANPLAGATVEKLQEAVQLARTAFDRGETAQGIEIYQQVFLAARDRDDVNVVPIARKLVELTKPEEERVEFYRYLAARDTDPQWIHQSSLAAAALLAPRRDAEAVRSAWSLLTRAYQASAGDADRKRVLAVLNPFLEKHVFSKRFSPLVEGHTVREGESLDRIANRFGTTVDAIKRLNRLERDIIQPGQRLIILPGKVQIFIKKRDFRLWAMVDGKLLLERPIGLGRDNTTPEGTFVIEDRQKDPIWYRLGEAPIPAGDPRNILGTRWLGFKNTEEYLGFGIHGTRDADSIGKESSSGCIRMLNVDIELLYDFIPRKTEVAVED